ncbi:inorganic pyrophosphatase 2 [Phtheirospermum japonicum]|uniref:Inorganic pyrophosphatase 2 n=1 Tax=Phtheirospermum japonicum TaxID=374723 RepID=A0A830D7H7_9LAMI|nr:inorganic pyrophosphatase 2 [Phtheirospermum japonicum]
MGLTHLFNLLRPTLPWNSLMELHIQGRSVDDIAECLKRVPLHPHVIAVIKSAYALGCDLKVVSDIITNPAVVDSGRLRIFPYHDAASSHGCDLCPPNLCKGMNDFCPTLKLDPGDCVMPRKNFPLCGRVMENSELVKAKVYDWDDGEDLAEILLKLISN